MRLAAAAAPGSLGRGRVCAGSLDPETRITYTILRAASSGRAPQRREASMPEDKQSAWPLVRKGAMTFIHLARPMSSGHSPRGCGT
jgi:hypothetical protein